MNPSPRYTLAGNPLESRASPDSVVLLHRGQYYSLEGTGEVVWRALTSAVSDIDGLVAAIRERYEVDALVCRADVARLLDELMAAGLVERVD